MAWWQIVLAVVCGWPLIGAANAALTFWADTLARRLLVFARDRDEASRLLSDFIICETNRFSSLLGTVIAGPLEFWVFCKRVRFVFTSPFYRARSAQPPFA